MAQDQGPIPAFPQRALRLLLAMLLAGSQTAPVFAQGAAVLTARTIPPGVKMPAPGSVAAQVSALRDDLGAFLAQPDAATLKDLLSRHKAISSQVETDPLESSERAGLKAQIKELGDLLDQAQDPQHPGQPATKAKLLVLRQTLGDLSQLSHDPGLAPKVFDNGTPIPAPSGGLVPVGSMSGGITAQTKPTTITDLDRTAPTPGIVAPGGKGYFAAALDASASPFLNLLPDAAQRQFVSQRHAEREELLSLARAALSDADRPKAGTLAQAVALLQKRADAASKLTFTQLTQTDKPLAEYLLKLNLHRVLIQEALQADAVPVGFELEAWELGQPAVAGEKITFYSEKHGAQTYFGFLHKFKDGSSRFQGEGQDGKEGLIVVDNPSAGLRSTTRVQFDDNKQMTTASTSVLDTKTQRVVREELADIAKKLTTIKNFNEDGTVATVVQEENGRKTLSDFGRNVKIEADANNRATVTPLKTTKDGPAPFKVQYGGFDAQGRLVIERTVLSDDKVLVNVSAHVQKILDPSGKLLSYEVNLSDLLKAADQKSRAAAAVTLAKEALKALGRGDPDGKNSTAIGSFLQDIGEYGPTNVAVRLSIDADGTYRLIYDLPDGSKKIIMGHLEIATKVGNAPLAHALIIMGEVFVDAQGGARQDHPGYWREYTSDGRRLEWSKSDETKSQPWYKPWAADQKTTHVYIAESRRDGSGTWQEQDKVENKTTTADIDGSSTFGHWGSSIMSVPYLGKGLGFCGDVGSTLYTGIMGAPQAIIAGVSGSDMYSIEAGGSYAKNPLMRQFVDDNGVIDRLTDGARQELYAKVREERRKSLEGMSFPMPPEQINQAVNAPISVKEAVEVLKNNYGAGTYGARLIEAGADAKGVVGSLYTAGGVVTGVFESAAEGMMNPLVWATFGMGEAVAAARGSAAVLGGGRLATTGLMGLRVTQAALMTTLIVPWAIGAADNIGKTAEGTYDAVTGNGSFDQKYYNQLSHTATDLVFAGLMYKGMTDTRGLRAERARLEEAGKSLAPAAEAAAPEIKALEVKVPEVKAPELTLAQIAPQILAPEFTAPEVKAPEVKAPEVKAPEVKVPEVKAPDVKAPEVKVADVKVPEVKAPEVKAPDVKVADVKAPEVKTPEVKASEAKPVEDKSVKEEPKKVEQPTPDEPSVDGRSLWQKIKDAYNKGLKNLDEKERQLQDEKTRADADKDKTDKNKVTAKDIDNDKGSDKDKDKVAAKDVTDDKGADKDTKVKDEKTRDDADKDKTDKDKTDKDKDKDKVVADEKPEDKDTKVKDDKDKVVADDEAEDKDRDATDKDKDKTDDSRSLWDKIKDAVKDVPFVITPPFKPMKLQPKQTDKDAQTPPVDSDKPVVPPADDSHPDPVTPTIVITSPADNATVSATVHVTGSAAGVKGVDSVAVTVDQGSSGAATGTETWSFDLNTALLSEGPHTITAEASDSKGNTGKTSITVTVSNQANRQAPPAGKGKPNQSEEKVAPQDNSGGSAHGPKSDGSGSISNGKGGGGSTVGGSGSGGGGSSGGGGGGGGGGGSGGGAGGNGGGSGDAPGASPIPGPAPAQATMSPASAPVAASSAAAAPKRASSTVPMFEPPAPLNREAYDGSKRHPPANFNPGLGAGPGYVGANYGGMFGPLSLHGVNPIEKKEKPAKELKVPKLRTAALTDAVRESAAAQAGADRQEQAGAVTWLPQAAFDYLRSGFKMPDSRKDPDDSNWWELALRLLALGAAVGLAYNSELPILLGLRRRKTEPAAPPAEPPPLYKA